MKLKNTFLKAACLAAIICTPSIAGVIVLDLGSLEDCCGIGPNNVFTESIAAGDPAAVPFNIASAGSDPPNPQGYSSPSMAITDGATLSWTDVTSWNNNPDPHAGTAFFLRRGVDGGTSGFTVTTANPGDMVSIDFIGGDQRDAAITFDGGAPTNVPVYAVGSGWTNVGTATGSVSGTLAPDNNDEGNVGAMRITITPVPEPTCLALIGMGALALGFFRRR